MVEDALTNLNQNPSQSVDNNTQEIRLKYIFIEPFQLKTTFYPLFIAILLNIFGFRLDLIIPTLLGLIFHICKVKNIMNALSMKLDGIFLNEALI